MLGGVQVYDFPSFFFVYDVLAFVYCVPNVSYFLVMSLFFFAEIVVG